jgi:hypothetical protein
MYYCVIGINDNQKETPPRYLGHDILQATLALTRGTVHGKGREACVALAVAEEARERILKVREQPGWPSRDARIKTLLRMAAAEKLRKEKEAEKARLLENFKDRYEKLR